MKLSEIQAITSLSSQTVDEAQIDVGQLITMDEFNRKSPVSDTYQNRTIDRLVKLKVPFQSNFNIFWELFQKLVTIHCPSCDKKCQYDGGGGNLSGQTITYVCRSCRSKISFSMPPDGISVYPK